MAYNGYSSVRTCRFYVNLLEFLDSIGNISISSVFRTLPVIPKDYSEQGNSVPSNMLTTQSFVAFLGHDFATSMTDSYYVSTWIDPVGVVNSDSQYNGYSISTFNGTGMTELATHPSTGSKIGSIVLGNYWETPHAPDLSLKLDFEHGSKTIETRGGASLSNQLWRPPNWGALGPWELMSASGMNIHSTRRIWNLSFSFLSKEDTFPKYHAVSRRANDALSTAYQSPDVDEQFSETLVDSNNFFTQVWNRVGTNQGFIFQPDTSTNEFAICKIANKSLKVSQVANEIYTINLTIREVW